MYVLAANSRKKRQEKMSGILGTNSSLGPAVHEGGKQSDTPFVGRPRLFDLGCSVRPAYMIRVHSPEAATAGPWPRSILKASSGHQFLPDQLAEWPTPLNRPSGSDCRQVREKNEIENAEKKEVRAEEELCFFFQLFFKRRVWPF